MPVPPLPFNDTEYSAPIDLQRVRQLFSDPLDIADAEFLRREIAARMHERLALIRIAPQRVLDAGCGTGADLSLLQKHFAGAALLGVDGSHGMLTQVRKNQLSALSAMQRLLTQWLPSGIAAAAGPDLVCADFAQLPLAVNSVDLVWSNLALHWHPQPDRVFAEWRRILRVDGLLMFSCFGPDTFKELRAAFAEVDADVHALPFVDMHDFGDMLVQAGFSTPVMDMETITVTYATVDKLMADVRACGGNPLSVRRRGLLGRDAWQRVEQYFERNRRPDGKIALTFEVIYGHAFRPVARTTADGETVIRFDRLKK